MCAVDEKGGDSSLDLSPFTFHAAPWLLSFNSLYSSYSLNSLYSSDLLFAKRRLLFPALFSHGRKPNSRCQDCSRIETASEPGASGSRVLRGWRHRSFHCSLS